MMSSMVTWPCVWMLPFDTEENGSPNGITFHGVLSSPQSNDMPCVAYQDPLG